MHAGARSALSMCWVRPQNKNSEFCAPLTSFDWNETDLNRLGTSSVDTTCTIWDIEVGMSAQHACKPAALLQDASSLASPHA